MAAGIEEHVEAQLKVVEQVLVPSTTLPRQDKILKPYLTRQLTRRSSRTRSDAHLRAGSLALLRAIHSLVALKAKLVRGFTVAAPKQRRAGCRLIRVEGEALS